jgi:hypothetical protein
VAAGALSGWRPRVTPRALSTVLTQDQENNSVCLHNNF